MSEPQGRELPDFPVDEFTLDQLEHALGTCLGDLREDGAHDLVGGDFTLSMYLAFMSGHDPERATLIGHTDTIPGTDMPTDQSIPVYEMWDQHYSEHDVIRALISEVRKLRGGG